jgi:nucleotide-binding universal stress UspA family protein
MAYKTVMVLLNDADRAQQLLDAAGGVALRCDAHLIGLYVIPAAQVYADVGMIATPVLFEGYRDLFKGKLEEVRRRFEDRVKRDGLKGEWRAIDSTYPNIAESAIAHGRQADLIVISQIAGESDSSIESDLAERLIMETGRPVLMMPRKGRFAPNGEGFAEKALVGINGTRESARAMFDSLPLLNLVKETRVIWVDPYRQQSEAGEVPGAEEAAALSRHGLNVVAEPMMTNGRNAGEALLLRANDLGADLVVMGAYAHSRMREFVFGGATSHVLQHMTVPVLMSH